MVNYILYGFDKPGCQRLYNSSHNSRESLKRKQRGEELGQEELKEFWGLEGRLEQNLTTKAL